MAKLLEALRNPQGQAVFVFVVGYIYICVARKFRATVLWAGVAVLLALGVYGPNGGGLLEGAGNLASNINWNVLAILTGAMTVAELFIESKVPVLLADEIVRHLRTVGGAALGICAMASFLSAFIDNVTTVLIVAPVAFELARRLRTSPAPFVIGLAISSNLQGMATMIGDPPSLILANGLNMNFLDFFVYRGRPGIFWAVQVGAAGSLAALWLLFFRRYKAPVDEIEETRPTSWFPTALLVVMVLALSVASQLADWIPNGERYANGAVCILAALVGLAWQARRGGFRGALHMCRRVDFTTVALLAAVFALTFALDKTGFIGEIADHIRKAVGTDRFLTFTVVVWLSVALSAVIDNIPYTAVMLPTVLQLAVGDTSTQTLYAFGLLVGACLGGNISPVGASANIVSMGLLRKKGCQVGFWQFVGMGLPFTVAATVPAYFFLWWIWGWHK